MIVKGEHLSMVRGDSETVTVTGEGWEFQRGDVVELTVRRRGSTSQKLIHKQATEFPEGRAIFEIRPEDTAGLYFGTYRYDIQLTRADGTVTTLIRPHDFEVSEEVSYGD